MEFKASHRFARIAPLKVKLVVDLVRGRPVNRALEILEQSPKRAAVFVKKVLRSAIANAGERGDVDADHLVVSKAWVGDGPRLRRYRPRSRGMATPILHRYCHIEIFVEERKQEEKGDAPKDAPKKKAVRETAKKQAPSEKKQLAGAAGI